MLLSRHAGGASTFYTFDPSGNVAQRLDGSGNVLGTYAFDAFGLRTGTDATTDPYSNFGGQYGYYTDAETGLELLGHRYYDTATGRFVNRDPIGYGGGIDLYSYARNNPINMVDPTGFSPKQGDAPGQVTNPANSGATATLVFDWYNSTTKQRYEYKLTLDPGFQTVTDAVDVDWMQTNHGWVHLYPNYKVLPVIGQFTNPLVPGGYTVQPDGSPSPNAFREECNPDYYSPLFRRPINWPQGFGLTPGTLMKPLTTQQALDMGFVAPNPPTCQDKIDEFSKEMGQFLQHGF
jgi:RHS repeat-associated protein